MGNPVTAWPMVVPFQALIHITRCSDVVPRRVDVATQHIDDPVSDSTHDCGNANVRPRQITRNSKADCIGTQFLPYFRQETGEETVVRLRGCAASTRQTSREGDSLRLWVARANQIRRLDEARPKTRRKRSDCRECNFCCMERGSIAGIEVRLRTAVLRRRCYGETAFTCRQGVRLASRSSREPNSPA
jgi:hypothetical protein